MICSAMLLIHLSCYCGKRRRFLLPAFTFNSLIPPLPFMFLKILCLTKYDKIMLQDEFKDAQKF